MQYGLDGYKENFASPKSYTKQFEYAFPYYLAMGMTYDQYWKEDCQLVRAYRKAHEIRQEAKNQYAWIQGAYFYNALCDVSPILQAFPKARKPQAYLKEPIDFFGTREVIQEDHPQDVERNKEFSDEKAKTMMEVFMVNFNLQHKDLENNGGETNA